MSAPEETEERRPGRPRDAQATAAILAATLQVVGEVGFAGFSVDRVAAKAGVGKATIYRRWPSKEDLLRDAFGQVVRSLPTPDTGSLRGDLLEFSLGLVDQLSARPELQSVIPDLVAESFHDPELQGVLDQFLDMRADCGYGLVKAAKERGELAPDADEDAVLDLTTGWFFYRMAVRKEPISHDDVVAMIDRVVRGMGPAPE